MLDTPMRVGAVTRDAGIPFIGTPEGTKRLSEAQLQAIAIRDRAFQRAHVRLLRITVGLVGVLFAVLVYLVSAAVFG